MSENNWTPGPWKYRDGKEKYAKGSQWHYGFLICSTDGEQIAQTSGRYDGTDEPNARLIAAAPELYEALKNMLDKYGCGTALKCPDCDQARAALAKAEGER